MRHSRRSVVRALASMGILAAGFVAVGAQGCDQGSAPSVATTQPDGQPVSLKGAGSTFAAPLYSAWFAGYRNVAPDVEFSYEPVGSGEGIRRVLHEAVDFGGTDGPMTDQQMQVAAARSGYSVLHLPMALGADVPTYNLPGVTQELNFTPAALAGIYFGKITRWDDPELTSSNPGVPLPGKEIIVVHRSDGSGTTYVWTDYLSKVSPEWKQQVGADTSPKWPVGIGGEGNSGVATAVKNTPNSIGYVELTYAIGKELAYGKVKNQAGQFTLATPASVTAAAASSAQSMPPDFRVSITDAPGAEAYPVSTYTWMLVPTRIADPAKRKAMQDFLGWAVTAGQASLEPIHYAPLPKNVVTMEQAAIATIK